MAGQIIISNIKTDSDNAFSILANTGAVLFSANLASGITTGIVDGSVTNAKLAGSISNDKLAGSITGNKIATGQITGNLIATNAISQNNIVSVNASVATVGTLPTARLPVGSVLQVVSNTKIDTFSTTSSSYVDVTGLFVTITPTSATSKILITGLVNFGASADVGFFRLVRNSTAICVGTASGNRIAATAQMRNNTDSADSDAASVNFLDSPGTTSTVTYKIQAASTAGGYTTRFNSAADDLDQANRGRTASTITVMEIAA
jgi:hypothetical protein